MSTHAYPIRAVWDIPVEVKARDRGMATAAAAHHTDLRIAREIARELGREMRVVCADDVRLEMLRRFPDTAWGNWAGSIFATPDWAADGLTRSKVAGSHSNLLRTWRLR